MVIFHSKVFNYQRLRYPLQISVALDQPKLLKYNKIWIVAARREDT